MKALRPPRLWGEATAPWPRQAVKSNWPMRTEALAEVGASGRRKLRTGEASSSA